MIAAAIMLDLLIGDPRNRFHPVYYVGKTITGLEKFLIKYGHGPNAKRLMGVLLLFTVLTISLSAVALTMWAGTMVPYGIEAVSIAWVWIVISPRNLKKSATQIAALIKEGDIKGSRNRLSMLVSRDTSSLDETEISRATIETVAENSVDGLIAPLVFALIGGPYLAVAYRVVNTLDSMVGYKSEKYIDFGWASAKVDDLFNFIPARLSRYLFAASSMLVNGRGFETLMNSFTYGKKHDSPNSGIPEASMAGALGLRLGGPAVYYGELEEREYLGDGRNPKPSDILRSVNVFSFVTIISFLSCVAWEIARAW